MHMFGVPWFMHVNVPVAQVPALLVLITLLSTRLHPLAMIKALALYRFGKYTKEMSNSFELMHEMSYYPGFMFHLRRSQFVQVFGNSPDETAFARIMLFKEHAQHAIMMVQPHLISYSMNEPPQMALVDVGSILPDRILFMDTYFYLVVHHGSTIARWRAEGCAFCVQWRLQHRQTRDTCGKHTLSFLLLGVTC
jgi:hypothetical protein